MADDQDLESRLQEIDGVGEKTSDRIVDVLDDYRDQEPEATVPDDLEDGIMDMQEYYDAGEYGYAGNYLEDIVEYIEDDG